LTLSSLLFLTKSVVVITEYLNSNDFQYQRIGKLKKLLESNPPLTRFLYAKKSTEARYFPEQNALQAKKILLTES